MGHPVTKGRFKTANRRDWGQKKNSKPNIKYPLRGFWAHYAAVGEGHRTLELFQVFIFLLGKVLFGTTDHVTSCMSHIEGEKMRRDEILTATKGRLLTLHWELEKQQQGRFHFISMALLIN